MNILEKIKELKALRAELGDDDVEEKQAYTETIVNLIKQMQSVETKVETKTAEPIKNIIKNGDFELKESEIPEDSISQIMSRTKYIPQ